MGLQFYVGEIQAQGNDATRMNREASQAIVTLQSSISQFLSAPLSGKAYDSAKNYFMVAYTPLCRSAILTGEALESAHKRLLSEYQGTVGSSDTMEDQILHQIEQLEQLKQNLERQMHVSKTMRTDLERRYINACESIAKKREKLEKFYAYNARSASIFTEYEACQQEFENGLAQVKECKAWNAASGTFDLGRLDMTWATPINARWRQREKMKQQEKDAKIKKALGKLNGYKIVKTELGHWYIMKDGKIVSPEKHPELYEQLEKCKDYLNKDQYTVKKVKIMKNEMPLAPGMIGNLGKIGKGIDIIRKSAGIIKVGQSIVDKIHNAPTINLATEKAIDDVLKDAEDTTTNKRNDPKNFEKSGDYADAVDDFNSLGLDDVSNLSNGDGMSGTLKDGRTVIVRPTSKSGGATIEIQRPNGKPSIKIRYK